MNVARSACMNRSGFSIKGVRKENQAMFKRSLLIAILSVFVLSACNTIEGMGKDIKKGGEIIEKAAK
jgi:predicted small secreted protein